MSWPRRLLLSFPTAVLAVLALQVGPALAQAAPTELSFGSDGPVWITVAGPGVPDGAQTIDGGSGTSLDFTASPGDVLQVSGAGYDTCTTVVGWEQSVPLPGGGQETTVVASGGAFDLTVPQVDPDASRDPSIFANPRAAVYRPILGTAWFCTLW